MQLSRYSARIRRSRKRYVKGHPSLGQIQTVSAGAAALRQVKTAAAAAGSRLDTCVGRLRYIPGSAGCVDVKVATLVCTLTRIMHILLNFFTSPAGTGGKHAVHLMHPREATSHCTRHRSQLCCAPYMPHAHSTSKHLSCQKHPKERLGMAPPPSRAHASPRNTHFWREATRQGTSWDAVHRHACRAVKSSPAVSGFVVGVTIRYTTFPSGLAYTPLARSFCVTAFAAPEE